VSGNVTKSQSLESSLNLN
jgi:secreted Zn-dependent insulinase-like peptidase